jgi:transposase
MFLRTKITPTGSVLQLVESYRDAEQRPRQRILASLGDTSVPDDLRTIIVRGVEARLSGQVDLTLDAIPTEAITWIDRIVRQCDRRVPATSQPAPGTPTSAPSAAEAHVIAAPAATSPEVSAGALDEVIDGVQAAQVTHQDTAVLGPVLVAQRAWESLQMPACLTQLGFPRSQQQAIAVEVINRLVDPVSEHALPSWVPTTALPELLDARHLPGGCDGYYRACDHLLVRRREIAAHLRQQERAHFNLKRTILLYDLTNTYFEGQMEGNERAKRGKSKEKRNDCPQVVVGMVFDEHGFELGHELFDGNMNDGKSLMHMVEHLQAALDSEPSVLDQHRPLVIVDGGIATAANRKLFQDSGFDFLANDSRPGRAKYAEYFQDDAAFTEIADRVGTAAVAVRKLVDPLAADPATADTLILCKSIGRREKELAIVSSAERRFLDDLKGLNATIAKGKRVTPSVIQASVARILARHPRVVRYYTVDLTIVDGKTKAVTYQRKTDTYDEANKLLGCYVLRTCSKRHSDPADWWNLYMTLSRAEDGFRALKSDLGLRPIRHQRTDRGDSHILVSVLAYHLLHFITFTLGQRGDHRSWSTLRRVLGTHCYTTIVLPTTAGKVHRLRVPGDPDQAQAQIYTALGINWKDLPRYHTTA